MKRVIVRGDVQGVGYRAWTEREARRHGLSGWVRNRRDGTVEALFCGAAEHVAMMLEACRRGPSSAAVDGVDVQDATATDLGLSAGESFAVLPTR